MQFLHIVQQRTVQHADDALADQVCCDSSCQSDTHADPLIPHKELLRNHQRRDAAKQDGIDRKSTRLNSSHQIISYAVFCLKKKKNIEEPVSNGIRSVRALLEMLT